MTDRPGLVRCIPFGLYVGMMVVDPFLQTLLPAGLDERWLYGLRVALVTAALALFWGQYRELGWEAAPGWRNWALGLGIGLLVFILWINLDFKPLAFDGGEGFDPRTAGALELPLVAVRLAGATLAVPVMEELFWRSFLLRWLQHPAFLSVDPTGVGLKALVISSVLFGSEHNLWFAGVLAGLAYGWLYKRSGNLWVPILAHAVTNASLGAYVLITGSWSLW
jgi:CAAX prenyl protease-like protein